MLGEFNTAQQKGQSLQQVIDDLSTRAGTDPVAALLLRDLWEVANATEQAIARNHPPDADSRALMEATQRLVRRPYDGEEVLF